MCDCPEWCEGYNKPEYILCSAIHYKDGKQYQHQPQNIDTGFVISGRRHYNCILTFSMIKDASEHIPNIQGFLTSKDRFLDRHESYLLALQTKQIKNTCSTEIIMSEDLW